MCIYAVAHSVLRLHLRKISLGKEQSVRGWIILDGIIGVSGSSAVVCGLTHSAGIKSVSLLALTLLAVNLSAKLVRIRA